MVRMVVSVVVGYFAMFAVVFTMLTGAYLAMGADRAFHPGSYEVTGTWLVVWFVVSVVAALAGGFVCAAISSNPNAPISLAVVVLVLGGLSAIPALMPPAADKPKVREGDVGNFEAMSNARQPAWVSLATPVIGAAGALAGARLKGRPPQPAGA